MLEMEPPLAMEPSAAAEAGREEPSNAGEQEQQVGGAREARIDPSELAQSC
jgi:hypothetical protein